MQQGVVCIFAKPPGPGAKTRLARSLGPSVGEALAAAFLKDTWASLTRWGRARLVLATTEPAADHGLADASERWAQGEGDLGDRMERVMRRALQQAPWALALGADSPGMPHGHLDGLIDGLDQADAALGLADDGGFWGLALKACPTGLLADLPWSAPHTGASTRTRLTARGLTVHHGERWFDLDEVDDLARFRRRVPPEAAPATWSVLRGL